MNSETWAALAAVVLGGVIAAGTQFLTDFIQGRRGDRARSHEAREQLYLDYCTHVFVLTDALRTASRRRNDDSDEKFEFPIDRWEYEHSLLLSRMNLVASRQVLEQAQATTAHLGSTLYILAAIGHLEEALEDDEDLGPQNIAVIQSVAESLGELLPEDSETVRTNYRSMVNAMRKDLGNKRQLNEGATFHPKYWETPDVDEPDVDEPDVDEPDDDEPEKDEPGKNALST